MTVKEGLTAVRARQPVVARDRYGEIRGHYMHAVVFRLSDSGEGTYYAQVVQTFPGEKRSCIVEYKIENVRVEGVGE